MIGFRETNFDYLVVDHQVEVNTLTGNARLSVPIRTSPGRESFGPSLALGYSTGWGNSTFGVGWFLSGIPSVGLDTTKELPSYGGDNERYVYSGGEELVPMLREQANTWVPVVENRSGHSVQRFRCKNERTFEKFERWTQQATGRVYWIAYARNGVVSVFGKAEDNSTRIADPANPDQRTFLWMLEAQYHPKGNAIVYQYKPEDGAGVDTTTSFETGPARQSGGYAQRYLKRIFYGNSKPLSFSQPTDAANKWRFEVVFDYGEHSIGPLPIPSDAAPAPVWTVRSDAFSTHRPGFELRTYRLCRRILMFHCFPELNGDTPCLVGATELTHRNDPAGTVLEAIVYRGYRMNEDGTTNDRAVPALKLKYSDAAVGTAFEASNATDNIPPGLDGAVYQWVDINNEGLPGVLCRQSGSWYFKENLGGGRFGPMNPISEVPAAISAAFQLWDFDNDGNLDLVGFEGREAGYYQHNRESGRWEGYRAFQNIPRIDFANSRAQWIDLNGDGYVDLIVERSDRLMWYPSEGQDGFAPAVEIAKPDVRAGGVPTLARSATLQTFFADMTGDGLLDMVRVNAGRVEYWPNLGQCQFGPGVVMEDAPTIDDFGELDARRLRFVDLDGSGTADLLYIGRGEIRFWINQSGNRFGPEQHLNNLPYIDSLASAQVFDFLGNGTRCLVWSTPLPIHEGQAIQYLPLTGDIPSRFLVSVTNGIGRETRLYYHSSSQEYLRDKNSVHPWRTLLPCHSMVVHQLEGIDHVNGGHLLTRYEYRDGYFDNEERRFVGFGLVDVFDSDQLTAIDGSQPEDVTPPSVVRNWYHTGEGDSLVGRSQDFYGLDPLAVRPPAPEIEDIGALTTEDQLDAYKATAGVQWRQEFYAISKNGNREAHPFRTTEFSYIIRRRQPAADERKAVFSLEQTESLSYEYEQDPSDPRVTHYILIDSDEFGNVESRASVAYPRRSVGPAVRPQQQILHAELTQRLHHNFDAPARFELGIELEERRHELTGLAPGSGQIFSRAELISQIMQALAAPLAFHDAPLVASPRARLITYRRNRFWDDACSSMADVGIVGEVTLLHHVESAIFPNSSVGPLYEGRVDGTTLAVDGRYRHEGGFWWSDDTTYRYCDQSAFFRLREETSSTGGRQTYTFDAHFLLVAAVEDIFGNRIEGMPDYQVLASCKVKDANDNISEVLYDPLGVTIATSLRGSQIGSDGNPHPVGDDAIESYIPLIGTTSTDVLANPEHILQGATRYFYYDLDAFERGSGPPLRIHIEREQHRHDGEGTAPGTIQIRTTIQYIDGFGRVIQTKMRADAGLAIQRSGGSVVLDGNGQPLLAESSERWMTSGHDVYNNKGWTVRKYEPLFTTTPDFESDPALREYGVATRTHYDPIGRIVRQDLPDGTFVTSEYSSWATREADANDNVIGSAYESERLTLPPTDIRRRALNKTLAHANTAKIVECDPLGRPFRIRELGAAGTERVSTTMYGPLGQPVRIIDPRNLTAFTYRYDMLGRTLLEQSMDAGTRCTLRDTQGHPVHQWDDRDVHTLYRYDENGRHIETRVDGTTDFDGKLLDNIVELTTYGDNPEVPQAKLKNIRGRAVHRFDDAGMLIIDRYHMDGQAIDVCRLLRDSYKGTVNWSVLASVPMAAEEYRSQTRLDAIGRVMEQRLPDGTTREYAYGRLGHLSEVRLTTADGNLDRKIIASDIQTNARGQRTQLVLGNGVETTYEYDTTTFRLERLYTRLSSGAARDYLDIEYTYDPVGNVVHWVDRVQNPGAPVTLLTGLTVSSACEFTYDPFYQLKEATGRVHQALLQHDYRSGLDGENPIKGSRHLSLNNAAAIERYTRLFDYDIAGNIRRIDHLGMSRTWVEEIWTSDTSNRSLPRKDINGFDVTNPEACFDANGNTVELPHLRSMDWNFANRLSRAVIIDRSGLGQPDDAEYYVYGADGLRVRRVTEKLVDGQLEVAETVYLEGCEIRRITSAGNTRLLRQTSHITDGSARMATLHQWSLDQTALETNDIGKKKLHYLVGNHLGSVSLELDEGGYVISYEEYFPFGGTSFLAGKSTRDVKLKEYRYSGKCRDDVTGFYCYEYRYYAPFVGNWLSPDPLGPLDGLNLYRFVNNNPIRFVDADGLQTTDLEVTPNRVSKIPDDVQRQFNADPSLEKRFLNGEVLFINDGNGSYRAVTNDEAEAYIRAENESGRVPRYDFVGAEGEGQGTNEEDDPERRLHLRQLDEILNISNDALHRSEGSGEDENGGGSSAETQGADGDGSGGDGQTAHPADGSSKRGSARQGQTGESGSNGSATSGGGPGDGQRGEGQGGGGSGNSADRGPGQADVGSGTGVGTGTGGGLGAAGTGSTTGGNYKADGSGTADGDRRGRAGASGGSKTGPGRSGGTAPDGTTGVPHVPPGVPTGPDGIPYSPDLQLPDILPEAGTPVTDPSQVRVGTGSSDARGAAGSEAGSGVRPGGTEGGGAEGTPDGVPGDAPGGQGTGQEGGQPSGRRGLKGGAGEHELPSWLSWLDTGLDYLQTGLDVIGLIPGFGELADGLNGLISLARGDYLGAALSFAAMIPFAGWAAAAGKFGRRGMKAVDTIADVSHAVTRYGDDVAGLASAASRNVDEVFQFAARNADELSALPEVTIRYTEKMATDPSSAATLKFFVDWLQEGGEALQRGVRSSGDAALRRRARKELRQQGASLTNIDAMHLIDSAADPLPLLEPGRRSVYVFGHRSVNRSFGSQLGNELRRQGLAIGDRFRITFEGFEAVEGLSPNLNLIWHQL